MAIPSQPLQSSPQQFPVALRQFSPTTVAQPVFHPSQALQERGQPSGQAVAGYAQPRIVTACEPASGFTDCLTRLEQDVLPLLACGAAQKEIDDLSYFHRR